MQKFKLNFLLSVFLYLVGFADAASQVKLVSWNIENLGQSKSTSELQFVATILKNYDVVAIQEVVAGFGGVQAVAQLVDVLNRTGNKWDYVVSNPTSSSAYKTERYAFLWKTAVVKKMGKSWLERRYGLELDREPFYATFAYKQKSFTLVNFHAITKSRQPETEIKYFKFLPALYPELNLLFVGDFNLPQSHTVFNPLKKMGYVSLLKGQKTTLKKKLKGADYLHSEFDNVFYSPRIKKVAGGIVPFYHQFSSLADARLISDHVPIYMHFTVN